MLAIMTEREHPEIENSPLCGSMTRDGLRFSFKFTDWLEAGTFRPLRLWTKPVAQPCGTKNFTTTKKPTRNFTEHCRPRAFVRLPNDRRIARALNLRRDRSWSILGERRKRPVPNNKAILGTEADQRGVCAILY